MRFDKFSFGSIQIDGVTRDYDVVIDGGMRHPGIEHSNLLSHLYGGFQARLSLVNEAVSDGSILRTGRVRAHHSRTP
jgi:hypothetical protein